MLSRPHHLRGKRVKHLEDGVHDKRCRCVDMVLTALTVWVNLLESVRFLTY